MLPSRDMLRAPHESRANPRLLRSLAAAALIFASACGSKEPAPAASPTAAPEPPTTSSNPEPTASSTPAEPPRPRKPFEVYSHCQDVVTIAFTEDPKAANVGKRTIAPSSAIEGARNADGNQTVWLFDNAGEPIAHVRVSRGMKKVEVGKSCRTLNSN
jgi:hypothetical protein